MRPNHSGQSKASAERLVKDIRGANRRHFSAKDKIRIVLECLRGGDGIAELCRKEGIKKACITPGPRSSWRPANADFLLTLPVLQPAAGAGPAPRNACP
jgi:transposase-like protein